ncbi:Leo1-like protein-domain-containing protein [Lasiosphaeria miniovina]|uniref:Leo1-like protein-domain-containing protein n=1 Tax=Lasiosphaeria miniovina TaxID=1954250 RepID=A0AA40BH19_9PEZI|nr:Leo1-like protein-domain-containing protein [Lasiosphaeria miniovina]KAK0734083.1 Leo1-like protein-domain-containing protein [Lasiosphaeria miniovina]
MSDSEDHIEAADDGGDDLFGDGDEDAGDVLSEIENALSDRDLDSDSDDDATHGRHNRGDDDDEPTEFREKLVSGVPMYRHRIPKSRDGSLHSLRVPDFIKLLPTEYKPDSWEPSKWELENAKSENPIPAVMVRRNPKTGQFQSNANIHHWSDGSITLSIGDEHFEIQSKSLAPPRDKPYQEVEDAHYYAAAAHLTTNSLLIIGHFTEQYNLAPNKELQDHALERLKEQMASQQKVRGSDMIVITKEDPELQKKQAELAEKERLKLQRRRETAAARADGAGGRYKGGALSIGDLEGGRRAGGTVAGRKRGAAGGAKKKHRRPEYDSDDDLPSGARRPDSYDMEDGFLVDSDDESEGVEDDEDEEELLDDEDEDDKPRTKRQKTAEADEDADADADLEDGDAPAHAESSTRRRRHIIVDDDEE